MSDASDPRRNRLRRIAQALWLTVSSGGLALWRAWREVCRTAGAADTRSDAPVVLVPGYRLSDGEVGPRYADRLTRAWQLCSRSPRVLVLSGYAAEQDEPSEAHAALDFLLDLGLPLSQPVHLDGHARNSRENLTGLLRLPIDFRHQRIAIVSSRTHLARLGTIARHLGLDVELVAAEARWRPGPLNCLGALYEAAALLTLDAHSPVATRPQSI